LDDFGSGVWRLIGYGFGSSLGVASGIIASLSTIYGWGRDRLEEWVSLRSDDLFSWISYKFCIFFVLCCWN